MLILEWAFLFISTNLVAGKFVFFVCLLWVDKSIASELETLQEGFRQFFTWKKWTADAWRQEIFIFMSQNSDLCLSWGLSFCLGQHSSHTYKLLQDHLELVLPVIWFWVVWYGQWGDSKYRSVYSSGQGEAVTSYHPIRGLKVICFCNRWVVCRFWIRLNTSVLVYGFMRTTIVVQA